jgi:hypothetical protein
MNHSIGQSRQVPWQKRIRNSHLERICPFDDNATIYFNSMILSHLLLHFEEVGDEEKAAITRQVSPVAWQNINLSGTYQFDSNRKPPDLREITRPIVENGV